MRYSILELIDLLDDQFHVLLHAILHRYPILVVGQNAECVDDFVDSLVALAPHRHQLVFWRDFTTEEDIISVWMEERHNYEVARTIVCSKAANIRLVLDRISNFAGWIVGVPLGSRTLGLNIDEPLIQQIYRTVEQGSRNVGVLEIKSQIEVQFRILHPIQSKLEVEKHVVEKILTRKKQSLERIRRLLKKSIRGTAVPETFVTELLQLNEEAGQITKDMFNEEISGFVHAARRAVTILARIRFARELGAPTKLTERNLFEAIGWNTGHLGDIIQFVNAEWHEDFSDCVSGDTFLGLGAWVDSMWGA
ncbi:MAG: hypothetical protein ACTSYL_09175 [Candidatus Thorarchaeota archaeon]